MILTRKAKKDFELYLSQKYGKFETTTFQECASAPQYPIFLDEINLPEEIENALIIEFFDSVGFYIEIILIHGDEKAFTFEFSYKDYFNYCDKEFYSRREALSRAIVNVNEVYNKYFGE